MTVDAPTPIPGRVTDGERERVIGALRARALEGALSTDTFERRLEGVFAASTQRQLDELLADVPPPKGLLRRVAGGVSWLSAASAQLESSWREARIPRLQLPSRRVELVIGRDASCDFVLADPAASRRHARLRRCASGWLLEDLGSRNGTRVNGWTITEEVEVRPGDRVTFGATRYRLAG